MWVQLRVCFGQGASRWCFDAGGCTLVVAVGGFGFGVGVGFC